MNERIKQLAFEAGLKWKAPPPHYTNTDNPIDFPNSENIKAGADIHSGDGGYSVGTKEKYDEFIKGRNQSLELKNERIKEIASQVLDELVPETWVALGYDKIKEIQFRTAELIVRECANAFETEVDTWKEMSPYQGSIKRQGTKAIKEHFGVEE